MNVLIIYATIEGQTRKIVSELETHLKTNGHTVDTIDATSAPEKLSVDAIGGGNMRRVGSHGSFPTASAFLRQGSPWAIDGETWPFCDCFADGNGGR